MMNDDLNRFISMLFYPLMDTALLFDNPLERYYQMLGSANRRALYENRSAVRQKALQFVRTYYTITSYDQIHQHLERWYLGEEILRTMNPDWSTTMNHPNCLDEFEVVMYHLKALSLSMISKLDDQIIYKYWDNKDDKRLLGGYAGNDKIFLFRSMNQMIPLDILTVLFAIENRHGEAILEGYYGNIAVTDSLLESVLEKGVAENHLHLGVTLPFSAVWEDMMGPLQMGDLMDKNHFLEERVTKKEDSFFYWCLARYLRDYLLVVIEYWELYKKEPSVFTSLLIPPCVFFQQRKLKELQEQLKKADREQMGQGVRAFFLAAQEEFEQFKDFIHKKENLHECQFLYRTLNFMLYHEEKESKPFTALKGLMLHYLRLKNYFFHCMVQEKTLGGLNHFQTHYSVASKANKLFHKGSYQKYYSIFKNQFALKNLKKLELRTGFADKECDAQMDIAGFLKAYRDVLREDFCEETESGYRPVIPFPRVGLVLHFIKKELSDTQQCYQSDRQDAWQYEELLRQYKEQLEIFKEMRHHKNYIGLDKYLVGIDVASLENAVPTWVFSSLYGEARDANEEPLRCGKRGFQSLNFTFHAGEDFRHLLSGIRRIYETVYYLKFHAGDRVGHGLALGIVPESWYHTNRKVMIPRMEAIENYIWAYRMLGIYHNNQSFVNFQYIEHRISELIQEIYAEWSGEFVNIPIPVLIECYELLYKQENVQNICCCKMSSEEENCPIKPRRTMGNSKTQNGDTTSQINWSSTNLLRSYHCTWYTSKMQEPIHYNVTKQEIEITVELQKLVKNMVVERGVVVEVNPSSNVTIGHMDTLHEHPVYHLSHQICDYESLLVCINSDDPGVFNTNAVNELGVAYFGMIEQGVGREACLEWIDRLRKTGMQCSFIRRTDTDEQLLYELDRLVERFT